MTLQWVVLLALVTTIIAAKNSAYYENGNDLLRWLDNKEGGLDTWKSPTELENEDIDYSENQYKNGKLILICRYINLITIVLINNFTLKITI